MSTNTKRKGAKLPKGLPSLPPVPEGYDAWEYVGIGWSGYAKHYAWHHKTIKRWTLSYGMATGNTALHYIRAIKHPAPKVAKKAEVKAVIHHFPITTSGEAAFRSTEDDAKEYPFALLNVSDQAALIIQAGNAIYYDRDNHGSDHQKQARAVLVSLGIIHQKKGEEMSEKTESKPAKKSGPWSYSPSRAMLRLNDKAFAVFTAPLDPKDSAKLVLTLNKGEAK